MTRDSLFTAQNLNRNLQVAWRMMIELQLLQLGYAASKTTPV